MVHNSKVGKSSTSPAKLTSRLFLIIAVMGSFDEGEYIIIYKE